MSSLPAAAVPRRFGAVRTGRLGPLGVTCAVVIAVLAAVAVFAPLIAPHDPWFVPIDHAIVGIVDQHAYDETTGAPPQKRRKGTP